MEVTADIAAYVIKNYFGLLTFAERTAYHSLLADEQRQKQTAEFLRRRVLTEWSAKDPELVEWLSLSSTGFRLALTERILRSRADEVFFNHCPKCGALARTPRARQCPKCFHDWHELPAE